MAETELSGQVDSSPQQPLPQSILVLESLLHRVEAVLDFYNSSRSRELLTLTHLKTALTQLPQ